MAFTNFDTKEINCKVLYFGPTGAGKTETLKSIFNSTSADVKAGLLELEDTESTTKFFDFLPVSIGHVRDFHIKLHLFTLPTNSLYQSVPGVVMKGVDGFVYIADSRVEAMADNIECMLDARRMLAEEGHNVAEMPRVVQYNKRDMQDVIPVEVLRQELNPGSVPDFETVASTGQGTMDALQAMAKLVINKISES
jgi:hypothetical protein